MLLQWHIANRHIRLIWQGLPEGTITGAPVRWQAQAGEGFAAADFEMAWLAQKATCPQGQSSQSWSVTEEKGQPRVVIKFSQKTCRVCPVEQQCTRAKRRTVHLRADAQYEALRTARLRDSQSDSQVLYDQRAGIEGSVSQGIRAFGLRRSRSWEWLKLTYSLY